VVSGNSSLKFSHKSARLSTLKRQPKASSLGTNDSRDASVHHRDDRFRDHWRSDKRLISKVAAGL
jgi:hypothetical protein